MVEKMMYDQRQKEVSYKFIIPFQVNATFFPENTWKPEAFLISRGFKKEMVVANVKKKT